MKTIEEYTMEELSAKIEAIKAEREKTANALKKYEEELERRKQEVPLGVPVELKEGIEKGFYLQPALFVSEGNVGVGSFLDKALGVFNSKESAKKHAEMLKDWRKALVANAKKEPITIDVLRPLLKKGKVLYSPTDKKWKWVDNKTSIYPENYGWFLQGGKVVTIEGFNLKPAEDWEESVMECGL